MYIFGIPMSLFPKITACISLWLVSTGITLHAQQDSILPKKDIHQLAEFINDNYDMGKIPIGKNTSFNIYIKNISATDTLLISDIKVVCGCTTPKYRTNDPIPPGKSTYVTLGFNGSARGDFVKTADILFKSGQTKQVKFHGTAVADSLSGKLDSQQ